MTKPLTVHNAEIKTAAVEVRTLTISGKQVTLAVFRQLREEPLIAEDGSLNGVPWGTVNYHPDKCADDSGHLHVVWQKGSDLLRSRVSRPAWWAVKFWTDWADDFVQASFCEGDHEFPGWTQRRYRSDVVTFTFDGTSCQADVPRFHQPGECPTDVTVSEARVALARDVREETRRRAQIDAHWTAINDLPQLFIAV